MKFYSDRLLTKLTLEIKTEEIISSVKRQLSPEDKNTFSIFYYDKAKKIQELKLRCVRRFEDDKYVNLLRRNKFTRYEFAHKNTRMKISNYVRELKPNYAHEPFEFYARLESLDLIMKFSKVNLFFKKLRKITGYQNDQDVYEDEQIKEESFQNSSINISEDHKSGSVISWGDVQISLNKKEIEEKSFHESREELEKLKKSVN
jgi:hypothetical protein